MNTTNVPQPRRSGPVPYVPVRVLREPAAADYCGFSAEWLRKLRDADRKRMESGAPIQGPQWVQIGEPGKRQSIRYLREDLDSWVDSWRVDVAQGDPVTALVMVQQNKSAGAMDDSG